MNPPFALLALVALAQTTASRPYRREGEPGGPAEGPNAPSASSPAPPPGVVTQRPPQGQPAPSQSPPLSEEGRPVAPATDPGGVILPGVTNEDTSASPSAPAPLGSAAPAGDSSTAGTGGSGTPAPPAGRGAASSSPPTGAEKKKTPAERERTDAALKDLAERNERLERQLAQTNQALAETRRSSDEVSAHVEATEQRGQAIEENRRERLGQLSDVNQLAGQAESTLSSGNDDIGPLLDAASSRIDWVTAYAASVGGEVEVGRAREAASYLQQSREALVNRDLFNARLLLDYAMDSARQAMVAAGTNAQPLFRQGGSSR